MSQSLYNTRSRAKQLPDEMGEEDTDKELLNSTIRDGDESFSSMFSLDAPSVRRSLSHGDMNISQTNDLLREENTQLLKKIEQLQQDNLSMTNAVIKKDEIIIKLEYEFNELKQQFINMSEELDNLKSEEINLIRTIGVLSDDKLKTYATNVQSIPNETVSPLSPFCESIAFDDPDDYFIDFDEFINISNKNDLMKPKLKTIKKDKILILSDSQGRQKQ